ncbi:hypothetical protein GIB67_020700 [Kingdonia uniflora]|uniref:Uncharacterized protein n=1 Tax=Kingdonia uniflora TaxID=39325 RepID=A0A7J7NK91_9MAGN|nr:hypothetical protein GIB67_020700 [Kingdonia uniflora]
MEESKSCEEEFKSDDFVDAYEEFPFFDCVSNAKWVKKGEESVEKGEECQLSELTSKQPPEPPLRSPRFRRRYPRARNSSIVSSTIEVCDGFTPRERTQIISDIHDHEPQQSGENSSITLENGDSRPVEVVEVEDSLVSSGFLVFVAGLVIKVVTFQISLVVSSFAVPVWLVYCSFMFITDPIQSLMRAKCRIVEKLIEVWGSFCESVAPFLSEQKSIGKLVVKFGWGFLWAVYVCFVLFGFLVTGFVLGGVVMRYIVEEPIQMSEMLNFDYTNTSPVALVPIMSCPNELCGLNCKEMVDSGKNVRSRVFLVNHKVQLTVSLTLPESEYNRKLGVFQEGCRRVGVSLEGGDGSFEETKNVDTAWVMKSQISCRWRRAPGGVFVINANGSLVTTVSPEGTVTTTAAFGAMLEAFDGEPIVVCHGQSQAVSVLPPSWPSTCMSLKVSIMAFNLLLISVLPLSLSGLILWKL